MNENLNLVEILKDCPKGTKLYTPIWGEVVFIEVRKNKNCLYPICINTNAASSYTYLAKDGRYLINREESECILFPSKDQRDWSKFTTPWLKKQDKKSSWKPSKEEMDVLYSLSYITNEYDEHKEDVITHLYQDLKREFFNDSSYENMFSLDNKEDDVRRISTIQVLEYARSLDAYNQYGKADIDKNIAWLKKQGETSPILSNSSNTGKNKPKFDPKTLHPFDKVLVRDINLEKWKIKLFSHIIKDCFPYEYHCIGSYYNFCIPYNDDTKHLVGKTDEAPEFYRYWEN